jgi:hypothetical protein
MHPFFLTTIANERIGTYRSEADEHRRSRAAGPRVRATGPGSDRVRRTRLRRS